MVNIEIYCGVVSIWYLVLGKGWGWQSGQSIISCTDTKSNEDKGDEGKDIIMKVFLRQTG